MYQNEQKITAAVSKAELISAFNKLGIEKGMTLEVHSSLSSFDYVIGGAQTIVDALIECVGYDGTIAMVNDFSNYTDPSHWVNPPISVELEDKVRKNMPVLDKRASESVSGAVVDNLRRRVGATASFGVPTGYVAWGKYARLICSRQPLHFGLGDGSCTSHLYDLNAYVLLLGVDYDKCTMMHLAEYRSNYRPIIVEGVMVEAENKKVYKKYLNCDIDSDIFNEIGAFLEHKNQVKKVRIAGSVCRFFNGKDAVDFACEYLENKQ